MSDALRAAGGDALDPTATSLIVLSQPIGWLDAGCDLELDILPVIRARAARLPPQRVRSWSFFAGAVADAKAARLAGLPAGNGGAPVAQERRDPFRSRVDQDRLTAMIREHDERQPT